MSLYSIIFAVDEGKRMKSKIAKPLQPVAGKALIEWVADTSTEAGAKENIVVIGHMAEEVKEYLGDTCTYIYNHEQQSTGNALMQGIKAISDNSGTVMVLYGDSPLITSDTLKDVMAEHSAENRAATVITFTSEEAIGYGKIICENGKITKIIEQEDVSESNKKVCECNSGMYFFDIQKLVEALKKIENNNVKGEYYITDVIEVLVSMNEKVGTYHTALEQTLSVNDKVQLAQAGKILNDRIVKKIMLNGTTIIDPTTVHITANVKVGADTIIYPNTILEGATEVGENCIIGPNTNLNNCKIDDNSSVVQTTGVDSTVGKSTNVGPFAYLRPNSHIGNDVKIGDFVEIKNSTIDDGTKVAHLTYVGDAEVGKNVNFGCGTVIVNYDGNKKHRTIIEDNCFIGCNTNLVSPVVIKKGAYTAAGSTITDEVPADSLAIARSRQVVKIDWTKKR